jgi:hypothetical protein
MPRASTAQPPPIAPARAPSAPPAPPGDKTPAPVPRVSTTAPMTGPSQRAPTPPPVVSEGGTAVADNMLDAGKYDEALAFYKILIKRNPNDRQAKAGIELAEGMRALQARDRLEAAQRFEAVLELDPANERAARELAEMRRVATNERKGMLSRLLGKKE